MTADLSLIGSHKVISLQNGKSVELKSFWQNQDAVFVFFRRWGCPFCRLWAKELSEIAPALRKNNVKLVGVGVEEEGYQEFLDNKFFDGDLYYVEDRTTYQELGFKRFTTFSILTSLFWRQSLYLFWKIRNMGLGGDIKGDWVQTGGALLVGKGGKLLKHFVQTGPGDHIPNLDILKHFGLEAEYNPNMANQKREDDTCPIDGKK